MEIYFRVREVKMVSGEVRFYPEYQKNAGYWMQISEAPARTFLQAVWGFLIAPYYEYYSTLAQAEDAIRHVKENRFKDTVTPGEIIHEVN